MVALALDSRIGGVGPALGEDAHIAVVLGLDADPTRRAAVGLHEHHIGGVDIALLLEDAAAARSGAAGLQMVTRIMPGVWLNALVFLFSMRP